MGWNAATVDLQALSGESYPPNKLWIVQSAKERKAYCTPLTLNWDAEFTHISALHDPDEPAEQLFEQWMRLAWAYFPQGNPPIRWLVRSPILPQCREDPNGLELDNYGSRRDGDFLKQYRWPVDPVTNEMVNWYRFPVPDLRWRDGWYDRGGFIQRATGWKPHMFQRHIPLMELLPRPEPVRSRPPGRLSVPALPQTKKTPAA